MKKNDAHIVIHNEWLDPHSLQLVAIMSFYKGAWLWVRNRNRTTWELPGGHIEPSENPESAAKRELFEETGAIRYQLRPLFDYAVKLDDAESHARMYSSVIEELGLLPDCEIAEVKPFINIPDTLTYPRVQIMLFNYTLDFLKDSSINIENGR